MPVVQTRPLLTTVTHLTASSLGAGIGDEMPCLEIVAGTGTFTANLAILVPITIDQPVTAFQLWSSSTAQRVGNVDVGIYRSDFTRIISTGSVATNTAPGLGLIITDVADTVLDRGLYYLAWATNNATPSFNNMSSSFFPVSRAASALGIYSMASAFPLPATVTPAVTTTSSIPYCGIAVRATF